MRRFVPVFLLLVLVFGCGKGSRKPVVVEESTPIVGAGQTTTEALGIQTLRGVFTPLIPAGSKVPCSYSEIFSLNRDGQTQIKVLPFRGTNAAAASNYALGEFQVVGIPPGPRGRPQVEVTFTITERQILMSASDPMHKVDFEIQRIGNANQR